MKIKEGFSKIGNNVKDLFKQFPITLVIVAIATILATLDIEAEWEWLGNDTILKIITFAGIWGIGTFWTEICTNKKNVKIISVIITALISFVLVFLGFSSDCILGMDENIVQEYILRISVCYITCLFIFAVYKKFKKTELTFSEYALKVFANGFITSVMYAVLALGILLLSVIFVTLILDDDSIELIARTQLLLFGLFVIPSIIYSFTNMSSKESSNMIKNLVYVLLTLITVAIIIVYMYMIKILIQQDMPDNFIYRIIASIFVFAFPTWLMANNYKAGNKLVNKVVNLLPVVFVPLILLEIYSIGVRISEYGLTPNRYLCVAFIVFQIITVILSLYKKQIKLSQICIYGIAIIVITTISPMNMKVVSNLNQKSILEKYLPEGTAISSLDRETLEKVKGAYRYICRLPDSYKYIPDYVKDNNLLQQEIETTIEVESRYIHYYNEKDTISVSGYDMLNNVEVFWKRR